MNKQLKDRLREISDLIDPEHVSHVEELQDNIWVLKPVDRIPIIMLNINLPDYKLYPYDEAFSNPEKMLWNELASTYSGVLMGDDRIYTVRANYGPAIIPSLFGSKVVVDKVTTWIEGAHDQSVIRNIIDKGMPDINTNLVAKSLETQSFFNSYLQEFGLHKYVHVVQSNTQGPFDIAEVIWGPEIYYAMNDEPKLVHDLLDLVTETIISFIRLQKKVINEQKNQMYHWWYKVPCGARIVDDVSTNISPDMYNEFVKPYNERIFKAFGNGYMHYCGTGLQNQELRLNTHGLIGIEMAGASTAKDIQEYNLESIWRQAYEKKVAICWVGPDVPEKRPNIPTGLIYLCRNALKGYLGNDEDTTYEQTKDYYNRLKEFWSCS